jgi:hypothetical protein
VFASDTDEWGSAAMRGTLAAPPPSVFPFPLEDSMDEQRKWKSCPARVSRRIDSQKD